MSEIIGFSFLDATFIFQNLFYIAKRLLYIINPIVFFGETGVQYKDIVYALLFHPY